MKIVFIICVKSKSDKTSLVIENVFLKCTQKFVWYVQDLQTFNIGHAVTARIRQLTTCMRTDVTHSIAKLNEKHADFYFVEDIVRPISSKGLVEL